MYTSQKKITNFDEILWSKRNKQSKQTTNIMHVNKRKLKYQKGATFLAHPVDMKSD